MELSLSARVLWAAGFCELIALILVLIVRRQWRVFPVFSTYISFQIIETILLYSAHFFGLVRLSIWGCR